MVNMCLVLEFTYNCSTQYAVVVITGAVSSPEEIQVPLCEVVGVALEQLPQSTGDRRPLLQ